MFELSYYDIIYDYDGPSKFKRFRLNTVVVGFTKDPIGENKFLVQTQF